MLSNEELLLIIYFIVVILLLTAFVIVFFVVYQRRKNKMVQEQFEAEKRFEKELTQSKLEIQEQTLKNVGWELHDNIGQLLSVANMQLNILAGRIEEPEKSAVAEIKDVVANSLQEVRSLSKSLNNEVIDYAGLEASVKNELSRFKRLNILDTKFLISGESMELPQKDAIILFRILQEFFSNAIKHSKAKKLEITFCYTLSELKIRASDNGTGFKPEEVQKSSGLLNMKSRAKLIKTDFSLKSSKTMGTCLSLLYPIRK
ncbi:sensor histidine kinase [Gillisia sp. Q332]|uniref:sensor histidine kinase n=1 Tax=Gillisia xinjiangensis TaxID=3384765 RepID=UPI00391D50C4